MMVPYEVSIKYMVAGYAAFFIVLVVYLVSLFLRWHKLKRDLDALENMEE